MNKIVERENEPEQLDLLLAQRRIYSRAKRLFVARSLGSLLLAIIGPIVSSFSSAAVGYVGLVSFLYIVLHLILEGREKREKQLAATVQELFDTRVLELTWNDAVCGSKPAMECVAEAIRGARSEEYRPLKDWYAVDVGRVDLGLGRVLCQRSNLYWDTGLRTKYIALLGTVLFVIGAGLIALAMQLNLTVVEFVAGVLLPCLPLMEMMGKQIFEHRQTIDETRALISKIDPVIDALCAKKTTAGLKTQTRTFQDQLFRHRKGCPLVLDWAYWRLRDKQEDEMQFSLKLKVEEYLGLRS